VPNATDVTAAMRAPVHGGMHVCYPERGDSGFRTPVRSDAKITKLLWSSLSWLQLSICFPPYMEQVPKLLWTRECTQQL